MQGTPHLWHPFSGAKLYQSSGSRTTFSERWSVDSDHTFDPASLAEANEDDSDLEHLLSRSESPQKTLNS
jgi:hypothetical protein